MYRLIKDFLVDFKYESESTLKLLENLTNESLNQPQHENIRTIGFSAWHIVFSLGEMMKSAGIEIEMPAQHEDHPENAKEFVDWYKKSAQSLVTELPKHWRDENLDEKINMYGEQWKKGIVLSIILMHQCHHRGQLTILMRLAGLKIHGIYGPAKEEWQAMNLPPMK